jgi:hypothetical protein
MIKHRIIKGLLIVIAASFAATVQGQGRPDPEVLLKAQGEAMKPLQFMDGAWRGPAWALSPSGEKHAMTQTERVGPFLGGSVKIVEGKGYEADGKVAFNAFATISYNPATQAYSMHSYAQGNVGDFKFMPAADGFVWEIPAGPMTIRYTAVIKDGTWHEVGDSIVPGKDPVRIFEMTLKRIGDSDWPAAGAISPKK